MPTDVTDTQQVNQLVATAIERFGRIDVWVGGAATYAFGSVLDTPEEIVQRLLDVNVMGQVRGVRAVLPHLLRRRSGEIIVIASLFSKLSSPYSSAYIASKHALSGFADSLRQELMGTGVRVSVIMPSTIDTPIYQHAANYTGRRVALIFPVADAGRVARAIVRRATVPRRTTTVGVLQTSMIPMRAIAHGLYDGLITLLARNVALQDEPVAPHPGTLFDPDPSSNAISGGWLRSGRHESWQPGRDLGAASAAAAR